MQEAKHTPGPWEIKRDRLHVRIPKDQWSSIECYAGTPANAELIAAAPSLLSEVAALRKALERVLTQFPTDDDMAAAGWTTSEINEACNAYDAARAALKKDTP